MNNSVQAAISDAALLDEVRRAAAAADMPLVAAAAPLPRRPWLGAAAVVLDVEAAQHCAQARLPRRSGVTVATAGVPGLPAWQAATAIGADQVLGLPSDAAALVSALAHRQDAGPGGGHIIAVTGARGGAGASVLAAAIALASAARRFRPHTLLVDTDAGGGGLDLLLGAEAVPGLRWPGLAIESGQVSAAPLHDALPTAAPGLQILACGRDGEPGPSASAVSAVLAAGSDAGDLVVCDVPRGFGPAAEAITDAAALTVLVVPADLRSVAAARPGAALLREQGQQVRIIVRGPSPGGLRPADVADTLELPLLAAMRPQPGLAARIERGGLHTTRRGPLRSAAASALHALDPSAPASGWRAFLHRPARTRGDQQLWAPAEGAAA